MLNNMECNRKIVAASLFATLYAVSSAGETLAVKALNYGPVPLQLPAYTAFLSNQMWILMLPLYWHMKSRTKSKLKYLVQYIGFGVMTFAITLFRNISVNVMPGSVFALLISTSIVFNMILSWVWLKKNFNRWHIAAALCCIGSALSIGLTALLTNQEFEPGTNFSLGVPTAIGAAFFIAAMSVWQEQVQPLWDDLNLRLVEMTLMASLVASALVLIYGRLTDELSQWPSLLTAATNPQNGRVLIICISIVLPILKLLVRNSKYSVIQMSSAFFFEFVQAISALGGSFACVLLFDEPWSMGYIAAFILLAASFAFYTWAKIVAKRNPPMPVPNNMVENPLGQPEVKILVIVRHWK
jgi:drug/metabolite transporter (DMT)-like permease